jgi:hypothetical protein
MTSISHNTEIESICSLILQKHANITQIVPYSHTSNVIALLKCFYTFCAMLHGQKADIYEKPQNIVE